ELSVYKTVLSLTRVEAHYKAGTEAKTAGNTSLVFVDHGLPAAIAAAKTGTALKWTTALVPATVSAAAVPAGGGFGAKAALSAKTAVAGTELTPFTGAAAVKAAGAILTTGGTARLKAATAANVADVE